MLQNYAIAQTVCAGGELKQIVTNTSHSFHLHRGRNYIKYGLSLHQRKCQNCDAVAQKAFEQVKIYEMHI